MPERERDTETELTDISQQWVKSFMTSKMALGKSIVSYTYTPILFRERIKDYFWFVNWILNLQLFHFFKQTLSRVSVLQQHKSQVFSFLD